MYIVKKNSNKPLYPTRCFEIVFLRMETYITYTIKIYFLKISFIWPFTYLNLEQSSVYDSEYKNYQSFVIGLTI